MCVRVCVCVRVYHAQYQVTFTPVCLHTKNIKYLLITNNRVRIPHLFSGSENPQFSVDADTDIRAAVGKTAVFNCTLRGGGEFKVGGGRGRREEILTREFKKGEGE